jgi:hypothetical protein
MSIKKKDEKKILKKTKNQNTPQTHQKNGSKHPKIAQKHPKIGSNPPKIASATLQNRYFYL